VPCLGAATGSRLSHIKATSRVNPAWRSRLLSQRACAPPSTVLFYCHSQAAHNTAYQLKDSPNISHLWHNSEPSNISLNNRTVWIHKSHTYKHIAESCHYICSVRAFSHCGDATVIPSRKYATTLKFMASRHRIVVALVGEAPLRTEGSASRRLFFLIESQSRRLSWRTAKQYYTSCTVPIS
jgi:hypothetical protein